MYFPTSALLELNPLMMSIAMPVVLKKKLIELIFIKNARYTKSAMRCKIEFFIAVNPMLTVKGKSPWFSLHPLGSFKYTN